MWHLLTLQILKRKHMLPYMDAECWFTRKIKPCRILCGEHIRISYAGHIRAPESTVRMATRYFLAN